MARAAIDPAATSRRAAHRIVVLAMTSLALAVTGCGAAKHTSKAGVTLAAPQTLHPNLPPENLPPGVGGDFTATYRRPGADQFPPGNGFIVWNLIQGGVAVTQCVVAREHPIKTFWCTSTYSLPAGQIDAVGDYDNSPDGDSGTIAVVGGTGAYLGARGTVTTIDDDPDITIHLK